MKLVLTSLLFFTGMTLVASAAQDPCRTSPVDPQHWICNRYDSPAYVEIRMAHDPRYLGSVSIKKDGPKARSFTFHNQGQFRVFVWNEQDDPDKKMSSSSGSRTYWFFPVLNADAQAQENSTAIDLTSKAGVDVSVTKETGKISAISRAEFTESDEIQKIVRRCDEDKLPGSCGGFEISRVKYGLVWDLGWAAGGTNLSIPSAPSKIIDKQGASCAVKNSDLLDYSVDRESPKLRYPTNEALAKYLARRCPQLDLSDLASENLPAPAGPQK